MKKKEKKVMTSLDTDKFFHRGRERETSRKSDLQIEKTTRGFLKETMIVNIDPIYSLTSD